MALVLKINPVGIDIVIDKIQQRTFANLTAPGIGWTDYESYHRAYKNPREKNSVIPEVYTSNGDYTEVLFDDNFNVTSFFLVNDKRTLSKEFSWEQDISIIYQAKLNKIYPNTPHRADEEMHVDIINSIRNAHFEDNMKSITTGINNVYSELKIQDRIKECVRLDDMSFFHVVKVDLTVFYTCEVYSN